MFGEALPVVRRFLAEILELGFEEIGELIAGEALVQRLVEGAGEIGLDIGAEMVGDPEEVLLLEGGGEGGVLEAVDADGYPGLDLLADVLVAEAEGAFDEGLGLGGDLGSEVGAEVLVDDGHELIDALGVQAFGGGHVGEGGDGEVGGFFDLAFPGVVEDAIVVVHEAVEGVHLFVHELHEITRGFIKTEGRRGFHHREKRSSAEKSRGWFNTEAQRRRDTEG